MTNGHVLVAGATGLVGRAAMQHYAEQGYRVTAVSRRRPMDTHGAAHLSVDLDDEQACAEAFGSLTDVTQVVFAALYEHPHLVTGWTQPEHVAKNGRMLRNVVEPLDRASSALRNIVILQGPKAYGVHVRPIPIGSREDRDEMREVPNFYWEQEDYLKAKQPGSSWSWTVFRPGLVVGMASGGAMNIIAALGVYAAVLRTAGDPLHFPGGITPVIEATDTELMARAFEWAATAPAAANQVFNITNGDLFTMRSMWPVFAECLGMEPGEDRSLMLAEALPGRGEDWEAIRAQYGLAAPDLASFVAQSFQFADFCLAHGVETVVDPALMSTVKLRQAGFCEAMYSDDMFRKWFARYQREGLLPPPSP
jgi:nucleoside-diphosphate-sugar epimerase